MFLDRKIIANSCMAHVSPHKVMSDLARWSNAVVLVHKPHRWKSSQAHSPVSSSCPISSRNLAYSAKATCQSQTLSGGGNSPVPLQVEHGQYSERSSACPAPGGADIMTRSPSHSGQTQGFLPTSSKSNRCRSISILPLPPSGYADELNDAKLHVPVPRLLAFYPFPSGFLSESHRPMMPRHRLIFWTPLDCVNCVMHA